MDGKFLVGGHNEGIFSVIRLEDNYSQVVERPFGYVDSVWNIEPYTLYTEGEPHTLFIPTTSGMYQCALTPQGQFMYTMESYYEGISVTNSVVINEDEMLLSLHTEEWNKLVILNLDTRQEKVILEPESAAYYIDLATIPRNPDFPLYFIAHTGKGV